MDGLLEEIEFLALSANRIEVLEAVREKPCTRGELAERTDASQPTLSRILADFNTRNWVTERDGKYEATVTGQLVASGITDLLETMETERTLRDLVPWLPAETMSFDLRALQDATITAPSQMKPNAPIQRSTELLRGADHVEIVSHAFNAQSLEVIYEQVTDNEQQFEGVLSESAIDAITADDDFRRKLRELATAETASIRVSPEPVPVSVTITDDIVHMLLRNDDGVLQALLESESEPVLAWARDIHDQYWQDADPLDIATL